MHLYSTCTHLHTHASSSPDAGRFSARTHSRHIYHLRIFAQSETQPQICGVLTPQNMRGLQVCQRPTGSSGSSHTWNWPSAECVRLDLSSGNAGRFFFIQNKDLITDPWRMDTKQDWFRPNPSKGWRSCEGPQLHKYSRTRTRLQRLPWQENNLHQERKSRLKAAVWTADCRV